MRVKQRREERGTDESFGRRLRRLRVAAGFTGTQLASMAGVAEGTIRQIETGNVRSPGFHLGLRLADVLDVDPHELGVGAKSALAFKVRELERRVEALERRVR